MTQPTRDGEGPVVPPADVGAANMDPSPSKIGAD